MSTIGLGGEGADAKWREANIVYGKYRPEIKALFDAYWTDAVEISDTDIDAAQYAFDERRRAGAVIANQSGKRSLVEVLRTTPEQLDALNVRMVVYDTVEDEDEDKAALDKADEKAQKEYGEAFSTYMDWDTMATKASKAYLIDYDWPKTGVIARGELYSRDKEHFPDFELGGSTFHVVKKIETIERIAFSEDDKKVIREAFHKYVKDGAESEEDEGRYYNFLISELRPYLRPTQ